MTAALIVLTALLTSILSGVVGMAGGMVLMAVLALLLTVPAAMVMHGAIQGMANGSRAFMLRQHIRWSVLPPFLTGSAIGTAAFVALALLPSQNLVLLCVGLLPWVARASGWLRGLDITRPGTAFAAGLITMPIQLLVGVSGPLLDVFFLNSDINRHQVVATKATTQTIGHLLKIAYYGTLFSQAVATVDALLLLMALAAALMGTRIGTLILSRLSDATFRNASERVILGLGAICSLRGAYGYLAPLFQ